MLRHEIRADSGSKRGAMNDAVDEALLARLRRRMAGAVAETTGRLRGRGGGGLRPHNAPEPVRGGGAVRGDRQRGDRRCSIQAIDARCDEPGSGARPRSGPAPRHRDLSIRILARQSLVRGVFPATPSLLVAIAATAGLASGSACSRRSRVSSPSRCSVASGGIGGCWNGSSPPSAEGWAAATRAGSRSAITGLRGCSTVVDLFRTAWSKLH